ncbi:MAG: ribonuclease HI, partial [Selenomonadaceae bacterium]|nr:ribonuclease HI [Selenomonadaceae bacterium]
MSNYIIYTDGSCLGNPGSGGYAAIIVDCETGEISELHGGDKHTTNNRMEMLAAINALNKIPAGSSVELFTDSQYLKNAFTKNWIVNWKRNGWITSAKKPVLNKDLWLKLDNLM